jgi:prepilin-type N-terminal cleavage/methylation domain-containing protein
MIPAWRPSSKRLTTTSPTFPKGAVAGFSLTEMIVVISVIGALAGIAFQSFGDLNESTKEVVAREKVEMLNHAVDAFNQCRKQLTETPLATAGDELLILAYLHWRDPVNPDPGSPFVDGRYQPTSSSDTSEYRIQWTGNFTFQMLPKGTPGTGLLVPFDGSDMKSTTSPGVNPRNRGF